MGRLYGLVFSFFALSYLASRAGQHWLPDKVYDALTLTGAYWMAVVYYGFLLTATAEVIRLVDRFLPFLPVWLKQRPLQTGVALLCVLTCILLYGTWNARNPIIQHYDITIPKQTETMSSLHIVAVSDIHLGNIIGAERLTKLVNSINTLNPDIVLFAGDTIDAELKPFIKEGMATPLRQLHPPLGSYAILGNHEYIGMQTDAIVEQLEQAGITVLRDRYVLIRDSFILAGRDERSRSRYGSGDRASLKQILASADRSRPIILLDHQPLDLEEAKEQGADLQISGHTHRGQLFPNNVITSSIFEIDWGYLKKDTLQVLVSSGYGTWGPPIRIGSKPEILDIYITFTGR